MNEFLKGYAKLVKSVIDFRRIKTLCNTPLYMICDNLSKTSRINKDEAAKFATDDSIVEYVAIISVIHSVLIAKMCRTYYTLVGIIIGIIISLLFRYFMG